MILGLQRPPGVPVQDDRHVRRGGGAGDLAEPGEFGAEADGLAPASGGGAAVRKQCAVVFFRAGTGGTPLEVHDAIGAAGQRLERPEALQSGHLGDVDRPPADGGRCLFEEQPGPAALEGAHQVVVERGVDVGVRVGGVRVGVVGDEVLVLRPLPVVECLEHRHEVGGGRGVRADVPQCLALGAVAFEQGVGAEAAPVQELCRVDRSGCGARWFDLVVRTVALRPERGAPGVVEGVYGAVAVGEPGAEVVGGAGAEALGDVVAVLVVDVPQGERRVVCVACGDGAGEAERGGAVVGRGGQ